MRKIFTLLMVLLLMPLVAWAATITPTDGSTTTLGTDPISITSAGTYTITGTYRGSYSGNIISVNANGQEVTLVLDGVTIENNNANLTGRWYALNIGTGTEVTLALKGENKLISGGYAGIHVPNGATLTIKEDDNNPGGSLEAKSIKTNSSSVGCGIGSNTYAAAGTDAGKIIIESGTVTATTECAGAPGIGGWYSFESIEIKGGTVETTGASNTGGMFGPGIGLSSQASRSSTASGDIKISGGMVVATGGANAAGIGCGIVKNDTDLNVIIEGDARVIANGGDRAAGIGGAFITGNTPEDITTKVNVTIQGNAIVTATGGGSKNGGAGIGGAYNSANGGKIKILGNASVTATGGSSTNGYGGGAGIGAGEGDSDFESIEINTTGTVKATAVACAAGIGGGYVSKGTIAIENGIIEATGAGKGYPGIGKNSTTTIKGPAYITAKGGDSTDGIDKTALTIEDNSNAVIVTEGITPNEEWDGVLVIDTEENTATIYGDEVEVQHEIEIPKDVTFIIEEGQTLKGGDNITNKGKIVNNGTIDGTISNEGSATIQSTIKKEDIKVTIAEKEAYDGEVPDVTVTVKEEEATSGRFEIVSYTYYKIEDGQEIKLEAAPTGAGSYKVVVTVKGTGKADDQGYAYTVAEVTSEAVEFTIPQKSITITVEAATKTYGDADPVFTYTLADGALVSDGDLGAIIVVRQEADKDKQDVGADITLTVSFTENLNYKVTVTDAKQSRFRKEH